MCRFYTLILLIVFFFISCDIEQKQLHTIDTPKCDMFYFYTDGYAGRFGGPKEKKIKNKQLEELLISIEQKSMEAQKQILTTTIENWKGNLEQVDDILIIGMRV
jgi:sigma-B regulation protein RsbU (phosphoserine phosphatase)